MAALTRRALLIATGLAAAGIALGRSPAAARPPRKRPGIYSATYSNTY